MMKRLLMVVVVWFFSCTVLANESFYYFKKTIDNTFSYTRIIRCNSLSSITDQQFIASDAVGPFSDYFAAKEHRELAVIQAKKAGNNAVLSEGVCPNG